MLQQTQVSRVLPKYPAFLERFPTIQALADAPAGDVLRAWSGLGYNRRAVSLHQAAQAVVRRFCGKVPGDPVVLEKLKGIGRYTARAVACFAYDARVVVLDTNVRRVLARVLWGAVPPPLSELERAAEALLPAQAARRWNLALMDLGATVCLARQPQCHACPLQSTCAAAPVFTAPLRLAEPQAPYRAKQSRFVGSRRYYRGKVVSILRSLARGSEINLTELGPHVKQGYTHDDQPWLHQLVNELTQEGLAAARAGPDGAIAISLP
jgi:A/G-specific adenine glycosylase